MLPTYIINSEALLQRFMGDPQAVCDMLECFCNNIPDLVETLKVHVVDSDQGAAFEISKKILRIAVCSSAVSVQECALQMEHAAIREDLASVREIIPLLEFLCAEAIGAINAEVSLFGSNRACWPINSMQSPVRQLKPV